MLRLASKENKKTVERHEKKFTKLYVEKQIKDGIVENSHKLITNLSGYELSSKEIKILKPGLRYDVATRPVVLEDIWDQIKNAKVIRTIYQNSELRQQCVLLHLTISM